MEVDGSMAYEDDGLDSGGQVVESGGVGSDIGNKREVGECQDDNQTRERTLMHVRIACGHRESAGADHGKGPKRNGVVAVPTIVVAHTLHSTRRSECDATNIRAECAMPRFCPPNGIRRRRSGSTRTRACDNQLRIAHALT